MDASLREASTALRMTGTYEVGIAPNPLVILSEVVVREAGDNAGEGPLQFSINLHPLPPLRI
jgi:hypothetical protein